MFNLTGKQANLMINNNSNGDEVLRAIHDGYHDYIKDCKAAGVERREYEDWLERVAIEALFRVDVLSEELANYQQAAQVTHQHYVTERDRREALDGILGTVRIMLANRQYQDAHMFIRACMVWN